MAGVKREIASVEGNLITAENELIDYFCSPLDGSTCTLKLGDYW